MNGIRYRRQVGLHPACSCKIKQPIPCTILDPFTGSGTTGEVAIQHGRKFIGIEINPDYLKVTQRRLRRAFPVFLKTKETEDGVTVTRPRLF
jgi:methylase of polypeptide subunit release factors